MSRSIRRLRIRLSGKELGPFAEADVQKLIAGRALSESVHEDAWYDEAKGVWRTFADGFERTAESDHAPSLLDNVTVHSTYYRVTMAGVALFVLWSIVFGGIRLWTGKWPGQGSRPHSNRVVVDELPKQEYREPSHPSPWDTEAIVPVAGHLAADSGAAPPGTAPEDTAVLRVPLEL